MKLKFNPQTLYSLVISIWIISLLVIYTPITSWITNNILTKFKPAAYVAEEYELSKINKEEFEAKTDSYSNLGQFEEYSIGSDVGSIDGRAAALRKYLRDQGSPLMPYAETIVKQADKNGLDWRLVVAISGIESRFCRVIPADTYNCWGWRGGPGGSWQEFRDFEEGIFVLTDRLAKGYGTNLTPYDIEPAYCPPCAESGHAWAYAVTQFMGGMKQYLEKSEIKQ